jgi:hypothetical protein
LFAFELARRLDDTNVTSNVVSPGPSKTGFGANMTGPAHTFTRIMKATPRFGTPEKGARTLVSAATDPELEGVSGRLYYQGKELATRPVTRNTEIAARLWHVSAALSGIGMGAQENAPAASARLRPWDPGHLLRHVCATAARWSFGLAASTSGPLFWLADAAALRRPPEAPDAGHAGDVVGHLHRGRRFHRDGEHARQR